jgi:hypothetical protein
MIKIKLKLCDGCHEPKHIWKNVGREKYCKSCYGKLGTGVAKKPKPTTARIPTFSSKREKLNAVYSVMRVKFLNDHPMCHARIDARCTLKATEVHHKAGRIAELFLDLLYWLPTCHNCHVWCELHPEEAKELGLSTDRLTLKTDDKENT